MNIFKPTLIAATVALMSSAHAQSFSSLDMTVIIDESGSMAGEHNQFIGSYVDNLDKFLTNQNVTLNQYGLVGFGGSSNQKVAANEAGRETGSALYRHFWLQRNPDEVWGSSQEFDNTTPELVTSGSTEDGYRAIDYAFRNFEFRESVGKAIMLITDEDRDNDKNNLETDHLPSGMTEIDKAFIESELQRTQTTVHAVVSQQFLDMDGNKAIAVVGDDPATGTVYVQESDGTIVKKTGFQFVAGYDTTQADYTELALSTGGTVIDIDALRNVYTDTTALDALSGELAQLVANITASGPVIGINCADASGAAAQVCAAIKGNSNPELSQAAKQITSPEQYKQLSQYQVSQMLQNALSNSRAALRTIRARVAALRQAGTNITNIDVMDYYSDNLALSNGQIESAQQLRGGAASADNSNGVGYFLRGQYINGDFSGNDSAGAYDSSTYSLVGGVDKYFNDKTQAGVALHYATSDSDFDNVAGGTDSDSYGLTLYSSHQLASDLYLEASLGYSYMDIDMTRDNIIGTVNADTKADIMTASVGLLHDISVTEKFAVQPFAYLNYQHVDIDGFTESGNALALQVGDSRLESLNSELGVNTAYQIGSNTTASASVTWEHELKSNTSAVNSAFTTSPNTVFSIDSQKLDNNYGRVSLGLTQEIGDHRNISIQTDTIFGHNEYDEYSLTLQFRQQF
ncbi:MAG: autotransporter domain-containing protein [Oceanisphaera sp.]|uniref:autotransporter domain-containing protein n=1 Tax=Oceanisphaera sp. TaxID=1929979 RepID=UPI003F97A831